MAARDKEEELYDEIEIEVPECFAFYDKRDPACRRCDLNVHCQQEQEAERPECFGSMYSDDAEECSRCLDASACAEQTKNQDKE